MRTTKKTSEKNTKTLAISGPETYSEKQNCHPWFVNGLNHLADTLGIALPYALKPYSINNDLTNPLDNKLPIEDCNADECCEEDNNNVFDMDDAHMKIIETAPEKIIMKVANQLYVDHDSISTVEDKLNKAMKRLVKVDKAKSKISGVITLTKVIPVLNKAVKTALFIARACAAFEVTKSPVNAFIKAFKLKKTDILVELFEVGMKSLAERLKAKGEPELKAAEVTDHISLIDKVMADLENSINDAEKKKKIKTIRRNIRSKNTSKQPRDKKGRLLSFKK